jgi:DinB family
MAGDCSGDPGGLSRPCRCRRLGGDAALELARATDHRVGIDHVLAGVGSPGAVPDSVRRPFVRVSSPASYTRRARAIQARDADTVRMRGDGGRRATMTHAKRRTTRCRARAARGFQTERARQRISRAGAAVRSVAHATSERPRPVHRRHRHAHAERPADVCAHGRRAARSTVTRSKALDSDASAAALRQSTDDLARLFEVALAARQTRVKGMPRRAVNMLMYLVQHDAHHRGQITSLARDLGHQFASHDVMRIWGWKAMP